MVKGVMIGLGGMLFLRYRDLRVRGLKSKAGNYLSLVDMLA